MITKMKAYISASLRVINVNANDIIATSAPNKAYNNYYGEDETLVGERRGWDEF